MITSTTLNTLITSVEEEASQRETGILEGVNKICNSPCQLTKCNKPQPGSDEKQRRENEPADEGYVYSAGTSLTEKKNAAFAGGLISNSELLKFNHCVFANVEFLDIVSNCESSADLSERSIQNTQFSNCQFKRIELVEYNIINTTFDKCDFNDVVFWGGEVSNVTLTDCSYNGTKRDEKTLKHILGLG